MNTIGIIIAGIFLLVFVPYMFMFFAKKRRKNMLKKIERLTDRNVLANIAKNDKEPYIRRLALEKIKRN